MLRNRPARWRATPSCINSGFKADITHPVHPAKFCRSPWPTIITAICLSCCCAALRSHSIGSVATWYPMQSGTAQLLSLSDQCRFTSLQTCFKCTTSTCWHVAYRLVRRLAGGWGPNSYGQLPSMIAFSATGLHSKKLHHSGRRACRSAMPASSARDVMFHAWAKSEGMVPRLARSNSGTCTVQARRGAGAHPSPMPVSSASGRNWSATKRRTPAPAPPPRPAAALPPAAAAAEGGLIGPPRLRQGCLRLKPRSGGFKKGTCGPRGWAGRRRAHAQACQLPLPAGCR